MIKLKKLLIEMGVLSEENTEKKDVDFDKEYDVSEHAYAKLTDKLEGLKKKAIRWGIEPVEMVVIKEYTKGFLKVNASHLAGGMRWQPTTDLSKADRIEKYYIIKLSGNPPKVEGFEFIAKIDHTVGADKMVLMSPRASIKALPDNIRKMDQQCDICKTCRDRNNTFILKKIGDAMVRTKDGDEQFKDGQLVTVGSSCLKRFLDQKSADALVGYAEYIKEIGDELDSDDGEEGFGGGGEGEIPKYISSEKFIKGLATVYFHEGKFVSKKMAADMEGRTSSTSDITMNYLYPDRRDIEEQNSQYNAIRNDSGAIGKADALYKEFESWIDAKNFDEDIAKSPAYVEYYKNLKVLQTLIKTQHVIPSKYKNFVAAMFGGFLKDTVERKEKVATKPSEYVGNIGDKITFVGKVLNTSGFDSQYGYVNIFNLIDDVGNKYKWFTSTMPSEYETSEDPNQKYEFRGTVKKHEDFKGHKSTVLKNVKLRKV